MLTKSHEQDLPVYSISSHLLLTVFGAVGRTVTSRATDLTVCHIDISGIDGHRSGWARSGKVATLGAVVPDGTDVG